MLARSALPALLLAVAIAAGSVPAAAQFTGAAADDHARLTARDLADQGLVAFNRADYAASLDLFLRSQELVDAPTVCLYVGRSQKRLGRWVQAAETFRRCAAQDLGNAPPRPFVDAARDARTELQQLLPSIPRITIVVRPSAAVLESAVTVDGEALAHAMLGVPIPIDPGRHEVQLTHESGAVRRQSVTLAAAERREVLLQLPFEAPSPPVPAPPRPQPPPLDAGGMPASRVAGFVALGLGAVGIGVGIGAGFASLRAREDAQRLCPGRRCEPGSDGADAVESFRSLRTASTAAYAVGFVGLAAGVVLVLTAPGSSDAPRVSAYTSLTHAGVRAEF